MANDMPKRLKEWTELEMGMIPFNKNKSQKLYKELCRGKLADVWEFVVQHVKSKENAQHIRGNLKYKQSQSTKEKEQESEKLISKLKSELLETNAAVDLTRITVEQIQKDIHDKEKLKFKLQSSVDKKSQDHCVISGFLLETETVLDVVKTVNCKLNVINEETKTLVRRQNVGANHSNFASDNIATLGLPILMLQNACTSKVLECIQSLRACQSKVVNADCGVNPIILDGLKRESRSGIKICRDQNSMSAIFKCVMDEMRLNCRSLKQASDEITQSACLMPVHGLSAIFGPGRLQVRSDALDQELSNKARSSSISKLQIRLNSLKDSIDDSLNELFKDSPADNLVLYKELIEVQLKLASAEASLEFLHEVIIEWEVPSQHANDVEADLIRKDRLIKNSNLILERKQRTVKLLWQQSNYLLKEIEVQQEENKHFVDVTLKNKVEEIRQCFTLLRQAICTEVQVYNKVSSFDLSVANVENKRLLAQSLTTHSGNQYRLAHVKLFRSMQLPYYKAPEHLLTLVIQLKADIERSAKTLSLYEEFLNRVEAQGQQDPIKLTAHVIAKLDETHLNKMPMVRQIKSAGDKSKMESKICDDIEALIKIWLEQPAKNVDVSALTRLCQGEG